MNPSKWTSYGWHNLMKLESRYKDLKSDMVVWEYNLEVCKYPAVEQAPNTG